MYRSDRGQRVRRLVRRQEGGSVPAGDLPVHLGDPIDEGGGAGVGPQIKGEFPFANGVSTLGTGWLGAYFVLSGSPVAATAISLFGAGTLTKLQTFTMLSGSRLGASFIVLLTGFLYAMRNPNRSRGESVGIGIQALTMTAIVYVPGMLIGYAIIRAGVLDGMHWHASAKMEATLGRLWGPIVDFASARVPGWALFLVGLGVILVSFSLLDRVLPNLRNQTTISKHARWLKHPWTMFGLGCLVAIAHALGVGRADRPGAARGEGLREARGGAPVHHGSEHHDARGHVGRRDAPEHARGGADRARRSDRRHDRVARDPGVLLRAGETVGAGLDDWLVASNRRLAIFVGRLFLLPVTFLLSGLLVGTPGA